MSNYLEDPFSAPAPVTPDPETAAPETAAPDTGAPAAAAGPPASATRRRTRASRAAVQDEMAQRRADRAAQAPQDDVEITDDTTPEDLGLPRLIEAPAGGVPDVIEDEGPLSEAARALAAGSGPIAVDAERASGYRYGQRAYLVQLRREGAGTILIDPVACPDLGPIAQVLADAEWVLHAASQDLPCLAELGLSPSSLFDTELGARMAGRPRVGLAAVLEHYLGVTLAKEHSAVDWSTRPLPEPWLRYAALDVEVLVELRDAVEADLAAQGKLEWARQEFHALTSFTGPAPRVDPWRRLSGLHKVRGRRTLAVARELWFARDDVAKQRDISPGRVLTDAALLDIAQATPRTLGDVGAASSNRAARRYASTWLAAVQAGLAVPDAELPPVSLPSDAPPPQRVWTERAPEAAARLAKVREGLQAVADERTIPIEHLLTPDLLRRVLWWPPAASDEAVRAELVARGARPWQVEIAAPLIVEALLDQG